MRRTLLFLLFYALSGPVARGQSTLRKAGPASPPLPAATPAPKLVAKDELHQTVALLDAEMCAVFNGKDVNKLISYLADDVEFYHDKIGLTNFTQTKEAFARLFTQSPDITRTLVPGSLEVYPVKNYGAMRIATQRFVTSKTATTTAVILSS